MKSLIASLFLLIPVLLFAQQTTTDSLYNNGKKFFEKGHVEGDYSQWHRADSIFSVLVERDEFTSPQQKLSAAKFLVLTQIKNAIEERHLQMIEESISYYQTSGMDDADLFQELLYLKAFLKLRLHKEGAEENILKLIDEFEQAETSSNFALAGLHDALSRHYFNNREYHKSVFHSEKSLFYHEKIAYKQMYIASLQALGAAYYYIDDIEPCLKYMKKAYQLLKQNKSPENSRLSQLAFNVAVIYQGKTGAFVEAEDYFKEAIEQEILANGEESPTLITYYSLLADNYYFIKDLEPATYYANKGYVLANNILNIESVYLRSLPSMSLSRIYAQQGKIDKAREIIDKVVKESIDFFGEHDKFTTQAYNDKAYVEVMAGDFQEAEKYYLLAVVSSEAIDRVYSRLSAYSNLTQMYLDSKQYEKALAYAKKSVRLQKASLNNDHKVIAFDLLKVVKSHLGLDQLQEAKTALQEAVEILKKHDHAALLDIQALALENEILLQEYRGNEQEVSLEKGYKNIDVLISQIISGKTTYNYQDSKLFYSQMISPFIQTAMEIANTTYKQQQDEASLNTAFRLMEVNKSSILLDGIIDSKVRAEHGVPQELAGAENNIRKQLTSLKTEIAKAKRDSVLPAKEINKLLDQQLVLSEKIDSIKEHLKEHYPEWHEARNIVRAKSIAYYQKNTLQKNQTLVEYFFGEEQLYRLVITDASVSFEALEGSSSIIADIESFIAQLLDKKDVSKKAETIGTAILPPFSKNTKDVIIVADGILSQIPFEVLRYNNAYLLESFNVSYAGSLQLYEEQIRIAQNNKTLKNWTGFAPEYPNMPLSGNQDEVTQISGLTEGEAVLGKSATKEAFLSKSSKASVLHLATHANLDKENPMFNKMLFFGSNNTPDELTASEIYNLDLDAHLAVLSACNTGMGKTNAGDGIMSMSRAFTFAGVSSTVMSLWKVPDQETAKIMVLFYENLEKGESKSEALRNAKLTFLDQNTAEELNHPYYWAGFVISGDISPITGETPTWVYLLAIIIFLVLVYAYRKHRQKK